MITSGESGEHAWRGMEQALRRLHALGSGRHELTEDPAAADVILVGDVRESDGARSFAAHELIGQYPDRCFSLSDADLPVVLNRGIYSSAVNSILASGRFRTGAFVLQSGTWVNPYVRAHRPAPGAPAAKRHLLSFIGRDSHAIRGEIFRLKFRRPDVVVEDSTRIFDLWHGAATDLKAAQQRHFYEVMLASKFALCPRGTGVGSLRLLEALQLGVAPVIVSDEWVPPDGPDWAAFAVFVRERDVGDLERIVAERESHHEEMGRLARRAYETWFDDRVYFDEVIRHCQEMRDAQIVPERYYWRARHAVAAAWRTRAWLGRKWEALLARGRRFA